MKLYLVKAKSQARVFVFMFRMASPRESPRSLTGSVVGGWFSSLFFKNNDYDDYDDPAAPYDRRNAGGADAHKTQTKIMATLGRSDPNRQRLCLMRLLLFMCDQSNSEFDYTRCEFAVPGSV